MLHKQRLIKTGKYYLYFIRWIIIAFVLGSLGGVIGTVFHHFIDEVTHVRGEFGWLLYLLPFAGLLIVWLYRVSGLKEDPGTNWVFISTQTQDTVPLRMLPLIFVSTLLTHLTGGSAGRVVADWKKGMSHMV